MPAQVIRPWQFQRSWVAKKLEVSAKVIIFPGTKLLRYHGEEKEAQNRLPQIKEL